MTEELTESEQRWYEAGRQARDQGEPADEFAALCLVRQSWHRAGWHDRDMELGNRVYRGPERTITEERAA